MSRMNGWFSGAVFLALWSVIHFWLSLAGLEAAEPLAAGDGPPRRVLFSTGHFHPPLELPARSRTFAVSAIELAADGWTDRGGEARLLLDESRVTFDLFGDATVEEKKTGPPLDVVCERVPIEDQSGEERLLYHLRLPADTLLEHVYLVISPRGIGPHRLLFGPKEMPAAPNRRGSWELELSHVLPLMAIDDAGRIAGRAGEPADPPWQPTRVTLASHHYWDGPPQERRRWQVQIGGVPNGTGSFHQDGNLVWFDVFGDLTSSTAMGFASPPILLQESKSPDPAGLGRRLFTLAYDERRKTAFGGASWPFGRYMLVLWPTRHGAHKLVVRHPNNTVSQVLPLHDQNLQYFERRVAGLKDADDELRLIDALRGVLGEGLWFDVKEGRVESLRLSGEIDLAAALPMAAALKHLKAIHLSGNSTCETQALAVLRDMAGLETLTFYTFPISDEALVYLEGHSALKHLRIYDSPARDAGATKQANAPKRAHVTDAGLKSVESLSNLEYLGLSGPGITDAGLPHLAGLSNLRRLEIHHSGVTLAGCFELIRQLPKTVLNCDHWEIDLANGRFASNSGQIDDELMAEICKHKELTTVQLAARQVTDRGLEHLPALASLKNLLLTNAPTITDDGLRHIAKLAGLKHLSLWYCSEVTDVGVEHLAKLRDLEELELGGTKATPAGVEALRAKLPKCKVKKDQ